ncbi:hypothetical protein [Actinomadura mexicana]|uniref:Uncharacterized protein n=1 Tax=Actinomadura mexicana TaxID=134959 RepID=A0A238W9I6_9ACTN|nr:hypothetical protein [Actinomadura mexicana]SNR42883.1 hypothetical protein SAMN06265355_102829 [Actinomadura mexicana]
MATTSPTPGAAAPDTLAGLFTDPETLTTVQAKEYTKKDGDSDQPNKYDEI